MEDLKRPKILCVCVCYHDCLCVLCFLVFKFDRIEAVRMEWVGEAETFFMKTDFAPHLPSPPPNIRKFQDELPVEVIFKIFIKFNFPNDILHTSLQRFNANVAYSLVRTFTFSKICFHSMVWAVGIAKYLKMYHPGIA